MQQTPKINKKLLSLANKKQNKKQNETPKKLLRSSQRILQTNYLNSVNKERNNNEPPKSPSVISISSDNGIECTPPHRRLNLDDSIDYSPKSFDSSFSPCNLLSQTLAIDSPEVGWRWSRRSSGANDTDSMTPDSAYAADSSYSSGFDSHDKKQYKYEVLKREEYRRSYEIEMRRAEKTKAEELLKMRCAKLQEQLKEAELRSKCDKEKKSLVQKEKATKKSPTFKSPKKSTVSTHSSEEVVRNKQKSPEVEKALDDFQDFFNDSDMDCFLLEATQQCESKINHSTQKEQVPESPKVYGNYLTTPTNTPKPKEKRTSLYMQFLEDDFNDDWLATLDEETIKATQPKKPRTSLQRYKSMPNDSITEATGSPSNKNFTTEDYYKEETVKGTPKFKRHASSHAISPSAANYRTRQRKC